MESGTSTRAGTTREVLLAFLRLGLTWSGGPVAHLGYFRAGFVERRRWLDEAAYGELVALCQFLPGSASSQAGFALGLLRGGAVARADAGGGGGAGDVRHGACALPGPGARRPLPWWRLGAAAGLLGL